MRQVVPPRPGRRAAIAAIALPALWPAIAGAAHQRRPWPRERAAPPLRLPDLDGRVVDIAALREHPLVLNFWASWCVPCRDEMPSLALMAQRHEADGLRVLTINHQEGERAVRRFLELTGTDLPVLMDRDGRAAAAWTPRLFPTTVLVARGGQPTWQVLGEVDWGGAEARQWIAELLARAR